MNLVRPEVQVELAAIIARMMAKEPERRYQTPGEVAQALAPFFKKGSTGSTDRRAELSQAQPPNAGRKSTGTSSAATQLETSPKPALAPAVNAPVAAPLP